MKQSSAFAYTLGIVMTVGCGSMATNGVAPDSGQEASASDASDAAPSADVGQPEAEAGPMCPDPLPCDLKSTGLYSDWAAKTVDPTILPFAPAYALWSDAAVKTRWIQLPPGKKIDVTNLNEWVFPVGTKFWKEFQLVVDGKLQRVETRIIWKTGDSVWNRVAYKWSSDMTMATALPQGELSVPGTAKIIASDAGGEVGATGDAGLGPGYEIPSTAQCDTCHNGRQDGVLGFETLELANADPANGLTWDKLQTMGLLTSSNGNHMLPKTQLTVPGTPIEHDALAYLHANCGVSCHNPPGQSTMHLRLESNGTIEVASSMSFHVGDAATLTHMGMPESMVVTGIADATHVTLAGGFVANYAIGDTAGDDTAAPTTTKLTAPFSSASLTFGPVNGTAAFLTAINHPAMYKPPTMPATAVYRIAATKPDLSMVYFRTGRRDPPGAVPQDQMPKIDTHIVDDAGRAKIVAWINAMTVANGYPPAP